MKLLNFFIILMISMNFPAHAENQLTPEQIRAEVERIKLPALNKFKEYLSLANDGYKHDDIAKLATWV